MRVGRKSREPFNWDEVGFNCRIRNRDEVSPADRTKPLSAANKDLITADCWAEVESRAEVLGFCLRMLRSCKAPGDLCGGRDFSTDGFFGR